MRLPRILAIMAPLAISAAAVAQPIQGFYVSGGAGLHYTQNTGVTGATSVFGGSHLRLQQDPGFEGLGSVGYALGNGARFEIQGLYDRNNIAALGRIPGQNTTTGTVQHYGAMANALFDMDIGSPWVYPYLGIGAGYVTTNIGSMAVRQQAGTFSYNVSGSQGGLALQAITGLSFPIPNMPGLSITPEYRFMDILGGEKFNGRTGTGTAATVKLHPQFSHNFVLGIRYAFNVPPPAVAASATTPPAAAPTRSYLVFFDWDKSNLTDRAKGIIKDAADNAKKVAHTKIGVSGNADTSGKAQYNQGLSMRRAQAVAAELVRLGVPKNEIAITANGDTKLLVATGPGVREPQNRRVEIVID